MKAFLNGRLLDDKKKSLSKFLNRINRRRAIVLFIVFATVCPDAIPKFRNPLDVLHL